jgi:hypothetical protein
MATMGLRIHQVLEMKAWSPKMLASSRSFLLGG